MQIIRYDIMSSKKSAYFFHTPIVKALIKRRGGQAKVATRLHTTLRTLQRTITNESRNGRLQRDLIKLLRKPAEELGYWEKTLDQASFCSTEPAQRAA